MVWCGDAALIGLATLAVVGTIGARVLGLLGVPEPDVVILLTGVRILFATVLLFVIWTMRREMAAALDLGGDDQRLSHAVRELGPYLATAYVLAILKVGIVEIVQAGGLTPGAVLGSLLLVVVAPLLDLALCHVLTPRSTGSGEAAPPPGTPSTDPYGAVVRRVVHILVAVGSLEALAWLWELDIAAFTERSLGGRLARAVVDVAVTALAAYLAWTLIRTFIDHRLAQETGRAGPPEPGEEGGTGATRVRTLLPLLRTFVQIVIAVMAVMIGLAGLGVNIGPLLAGAGISGIAIGFGTQTLVRDIVSGVFFLVDDSFRLGEYVDVGPVKGTVERISLRSMQIRHHRGALHTIPFGEVKRLTNHSREWVIHKVELPLPPETDLDVIRKMLKRIGEELVADPELGPHILQPLKSQGLMEVEDGALILRAKFMVRPDDQQFVIRREVLSRIEPPCRRRASASPLARSWCTSRSRRAVRTRRRGSRRTDIPCPPMRWPAPRPRASCPGGRSPTLARFPPSGDPRSVVRSILDPAVDESRGPLLLSARRVPRPSDRFVDRGRRCPARGPRQRLHVRRRAADGGAPPRAGRAVPADGGGRSCAAVSRSGQDRGLRAPRAPRRPRLTYRRTNRGIPHVPRRLHRTREPRRRPLDPVVPEFHRRSDRSGRAISAGRREAASSWRAARITAGFLLRPDGLST